MEKNLLKQSGIIAVIITFLALTFWFGFSKISLGIDTSNWTKGALKKDSVVSEQLIIMCGTSGSGIVFGTTSGVWVGTPTDSTLARIFFNTATGKLEFKPSGTTTSYPFGSVTVAYLDANYATIAALSSYLLSTGGVGTSNTFNTPTLTSAQLAGSTTIGTDSTITAGGSPFAGTKVGYLADVEQNIGSHIDTKLTKVGGVNTYIGSITAGGKTGTTSFSIVDGTNITSTSTLTADGHLEMTINASGSFSSNFSTIAGTPTDNTFFGTSSGANKVPMSDADGAIAVGSITTPAIKFSADNSIQSYASSMLYATSAVFYDTQTGTQAAFLDVTNLTLTITPHTVNSRFILFPAISACMADGGAVYFRLMRNNIGIGTGTAAGSRQSVTGVAGTPASGAGLGSFCMPFTDSPGTSSPVTYKVQFAPYSAATTAYINQSSTDSDAYGSPRAISSLHLLELAN